MASSKSSFWQKGWRKRLRSSRGLDVALGDYVTALVVALAAALLAQTPAPRMLDGLFFDSVTRFDAGRTPKVVIVDQTQAVPSGESAALELAAENLRITRLCYRVAPEISPNSVDISASAPGISDTVVAGRDVERIPAGNGWRFAGSSEFPANIAAANNRIATPEYGVHRRQLFGQKGASEPIPMLETACAGRQAALGSYLVRMPRAQNIPRVTAGQLLSGEFQESELAGMIALVAPPSDRTEPYFPTPLTPGARGTSATLFSAYAIQALADGREVYRAGPWASLMLLIVAALSAALLMRLLPSKRFAVLAAFGGLLLVTAAGWAVLQFVHALMPISAMLLAFALTAAALILRHERAQDRKLGQTLERAINLSFTRSVFYDHSRIPDYLLSLARLLKLPKMAVLERGADTLWHVLAAHNAENSELALTAPAARRQLEKLQRAQKPLSAQILAPEWGDTTRVALVSSGDSEIAWVYDVLPGRKGAITGRVVTAIASSLRQMRNWQHSMLGNADGKSRQIPIDARVSSAANLITVQSEQIRQGLDALDTAVLIFHPAGFALQANVRMAALCEQIELPLERTSIAEAILALTELTPEQADSVVERMLVRGGDMRVPMRDIASRQYMLRIAATPGRDEAWRRVVVLEAVDVSDLDQLAELRQAVGVFIDRQLRNDLEAITLGATLAADPRLKEGALNRIIGRIKDVAARATGRLEEVAELLGELPPGLIPSYPIEARNSVAQALERVSELADEMAVTIDAQLPGISGFTIAEPFMLSDMVEAILRLVIADTAQGGTITLLLEEVDNHTRIRIAGGFGMPFDRLVEALDARAGEVPSEFQIAAAGFAEVLAWQGSVSYWSAAGDGYKFNIQLRRIG
ncbi:hypothetical protein [Qipengyuania marisflavi]|uniref:CHASE2 domain-containing protein n=1 Tax=Qipengyuania marisflavi TaxID=2486356 RepID=A0A5S3PX69_9SPHN|nr:hypothetical protein [Qipengyuania marisflavi]TMM48195.1 hypothetical protein FEV51_07835 [Qipengyuania marisflavi]